jgi:hypothetical protein
MIMFLASVPDYIPIYSTYCIVGYDNAFISIIVENLVYMRFRYSYT